MPGLSPLGLLAGTSPPPPPAPAPSSAIPPGSLDSAALDSAALDSAPSDVAANFRAALEPLLRADPTLATLYGGGIWFEAAPGRKAYPYATYAEMTGDGKPNAGPNFYEYLDCRFNFYDADDARAEAFGSALLARLRAVAPATGPTQIRFADGYLMGWRLLGRWKVPVDRPLSPAASAWQQIVAVRFTLGRNP